MDPPMKKMKDSSEQVSSNADDRISALPDALLHHILSFLMMRDAVATSLLSMRWRYLWMSTPTLDFGIWAPQNISIALVLYEGLTILKFHACSDGWDDATSHFNSWIRFVVRRKVQELDLQFGGDEHPVDYYRVHRCLFTCGSVEVLKLRICVLNLPTFVLLPLLKSLELYHLKLTDVDIKVLTSGCPLLENMTLVGCNHDIMLNVFASNQNLKRLRIVDKMYEHYDLYALYDEDEPEIDIFAPYVLSLELGGYVRKNYIIRNLSSITSVGFDFEEQLLVENHGEVNQLVGLLRDLSHAKTLKLCRWCVQALGAREVVDPISLNLHITCLELKTGLSQLDYLGIAVLLRSSCHVESLAIDISEKDLDDLSDKSSEYDDMKAVLKSPDLSLSCQFWNLKTIKIYGFMGLWIYGDEFIEGQEKEVELIRFLLKNSRKLDKLIIGTTKAANFYGYAKMSELLPNLTKMLLLLPRASRNAEIVFS